MVVQWLRLLTSSAGGAGSIPGRGTKIHMPCGAAKKYIYLFQICAALSNLLLDWLQAEPSILRAGTGERQASKRNAWGALLKKAPRE